MPSEAVWGPLDIYEALKKFKIFHENGKLKTEVCQDEDGKRVWDEAAKALAPMKRHNLYLTVQKNIGSVRKWLKAYHFPKTVRMLHEEIEEVPPTFEDTLCEEYEVDANNIEEKKNEVIVKEDEFVPLHEMKYSLQFADIIQRIGIIPFHMTYWSVQQKNIYKDIVKMDEYSICITILKDILPSIQLKNYTSKENSLVAISGTISDRPIFLAHLITETLDEQFVRHFTMEFFKEVPKLPSDITIGYHKTSVEEVCFGLNTCSFSDHNTQCFLYLQKKSHRLPKVLISVDLIGLLISVCRSPDFELISDDISKNLIKFLIYLKYVPSIEEFKTTVEEILLLISCPFENSSSLKTAGVLESKIKLSTIYELYEEYITVKNDHIFHTHKEISNVEDFQTSKVIFQYIEALKPNINAKLCETKTPNPYYCETWYKTKLVFALSAFPSWTCLLNESCNVNLIKNVSQIQVNDINSQKPIATIHQFLERHIIQCDQQVERRRAFLNLKKFQKSKKKEKRKIERLEQNLCHLDNEENWGGLNECYKERNLIAENKFEISEIIDEPCMMPLKNDNNSSFRHVPSLIEAGENIFPNENAKSPILENSYLLAGSMFTKSVHKDSSSMSQTLESTIGDPYKNSTPSAETNNNQSTVFQETETSMALLLNNNIDSDAKDLEHSVDPEGVIEEESPKKPSIVWSSKAEQEEVSHSSVKLKRKKPAVDTRKKKYCTACPDAIRRHQQAPNSKSNGTDHLIRNGNGQEPRSINAMKYYIDNTSKFDVLAEIFSFSCKNCLSFRNYCDKLVDVDCSTTCLIKLIKKFSQTNSINTMYADRAILLYECAYRDEESSKISIHADLCDFFCRIMLEHSSFTINNLCQYCNTETSYENYVITVDVTLNPISKLRDFVVNFFIESLTCYECCILCQQKGSLSLIMGAYLAISLKDRVFDFVDSAPLYIKLNDECEYMLIGVVTYSSDKDPLYVAYCRRPTGSWEMYNSKLKKVVYCQNLEQENIVFIIYVKV